MTTAPVLVFQQPDGSLREVALADAPIVLGRAPECDIVVAGRLISRQHARVWRDGQAYLIEDLASHNGTSVNGQIISTPWILRDGDQIELGGLGKLTFVDNEATRTRPHAPAEGIWLDPATQDVWVDGLRLLPPVSPAQFALMQMLVARIDQICSRAEVIDAVWPDTPDGVSDEAIDALIKRVRARLAEAPAGQRYLATLRGRGLILHSPGSLRRR